MSKETISQTEGLCKEVATCVRSAYDRGYKQGEKDGYRDGQNIEQSNAITTKEEVAKMEYERGLNDAWECARKIVVPIADGGLSYEGLFQMFEHRSTAEILREFSASEVIAKIKKYEEKQKQVTRQTIIKSQLLDIINGQKNPVTVDEIVEVLEQMKEIKNDV